MSLPKVELGDVVKLRLKDPLETADKVRILGFMILQILSLIAPQLQTLVRLLLASRLLRTWQRLRMPYNSMQRAVAWDNVVTIYQNDFPQRIWASIKQWRRQPSR